MGYRDSAMKIARSITLLLLASCLAGQSAWAHGPRARVGVYVGPVWSPFWYPAPWPYYPPPVIVMPPAPPPVYVEQARPAPEAAEYWYYCRSAGGYYPAVSVCPQGWLPVLPEPSAPPATTPALQE